MPEPGEVRITAPQTMSMFTLASDPSMSKQATALFCALTKALKRIGEIRITERELSEFAFTMRTDGGPIRVLTGTDLNKRPFETIYRVGLRKGNEQGVFAAMPKRNRVITLE